jgi:tetratricopeptide (TPR) repeat protein
LAACAAVAGLGFADGGYFPSEWGLATLGFALLAVTVLLVTDAPRPPTLALAFVGGLAALALWALASSLWSPGVAAPVLEAERGLLYVAAAAAALLLLVGRGGAVPLLGGIVAGATGLALYALATRLFPGHVGGAYDPSSGYQLAEPIGYWNALALVCAIALLLAGGLVAHARHGAARALAAAALVPLLATLYFTFSRGALAALVAGAAVQIASDRRRARLLAAALVTGAPAALGVLYAARFRSLRAAGETLTTAQQQGREVATALAVLALVGACAAVAFHFAERRLRLPARAGTALVAAAGAAALVGLAGALVAAGGPRDAVDRATASFREPLSAGEGDLQRRLLSVSGNGRGDYWRVAWETAGDEPLLGAGAGSFEAEWLLERPVAFHARDAHNLYLETLAELGPLGLALLLATLALPLAALREARRLPFGAAAGGAFAAFVVHAAVDWDWEVPAVTVAALLCAVVLVASGRADDEPWLTGRRRRVAPTLAVPVVVAALVAHVGNRAAADSAAAAERGDPERALAAARRAVTWSPWSHEAWQLRGEAELDLARDAEARRSLRRALELNPESWSTWYVLAIAGDDRALERAKALNPLSPEVDELHTER